MTRQGQVAEERILTFGKFQGWKLSDLAKAGDVGRGYLEWGAGHLINPQWRAAFTEALMINGIDRELWAKAITVSETDVPLEEARREVEEIVAEQNDEEERYENMMNEQEVIINKYAPRFGLEPDQLRRKAEQVLCALDRGQALKFSCPERRESFMGFLDEWQEAGGW